MQQGRQRAEVTETQETLSSRGWNQRARPAGLPAVRRVPAKVLPCESRSQRESVFYKRLRAKEKQQCREVCD